MQATLRTPSVGRLRRLGLAGAVALLAAMLAVPGAAAPDLRSARRVLVMVQDPGCPYCVRWEAEVGRSYRLSEEGKFAPLVVRLRGDADIAHLKKVVYSPTFVMLAYGQEVGRIVGYQGRDLFWMQLEGLMAQAGLAAQSTTP